MRARAPDGGRNLACCHCRHFHWLPGLQHRQRTRGGDARRAPFHWWQRHPPPSAPSSRLPPSSLPLLSPARRPLPCHHSNLHPPPSSPPLFTSPLRTHRPPPLRSLCCPCACEQEEDSESAHRRCHRHRLVRKRSQQQRPSPHAPAERQSIRTPSFPAPASPSSHGLLMGSLGWTAPSVRTAARVAPPPPPGLSQTPHPHPNPCSS